MGWTADYDDESRITTVVFRGATNGGDLRAASLAAITLSKTEGGWRFLVDITEASLAVSSIELLNFPVKQYPEEQLDRGSRIAVLLPATAKERELARLYETACLNRDWLVQSFDDRGAARSWLLGVSR